MQLWHVTDAESAKSILQVGFEPDWGDVGFGVYFFTELEEAEAYASAGGWDGSLDADTAEILEVTCSEIDVEHIFPDPAWPNPEAYENVVVRLMDEGEPNWRPDDMRLLPGEENTP